MTKSISPDAVSFTVTSVRVIGIAAKPFLLTATVTEPELSETVYSAAANPTLITEKVE